MFEGESIEVVGEDVRVDKYTICDSPIIATIVIEQKNYFDTIEDAYRWLKEKREKIREINHEIHNHSN